MGSLLQWREPFTEASRLPDLFHPPKVKHHSPTPLLGGGILQHCSSWEARRPKAEASKDTRQRCSLHPSTPTHPPRPSRPLRSTFGWGSRGRWRRSNAF